MCFVSLVNGYSVQKEPKMYPFSGACLHCRHGSFMSDIGVEGLSSGNSSNWTFIFWQVIISTNWSARASYCRGNHGVSCDRCQRCSARREVTLDSFGGICRRERERGASATQHCSVSSPDIFHFLLETEELLAANPAMGRLCFFVIRLYYSVMSLEV